MAVRNGYPIKEDLKPLGFRWGGTHAGNPNREWRIPNGLHSEERREIARKIDMACVQVKFMDLRCKYVPGGCGPSRDLSISSTRGSEAHGSVGGT